MKWPRFVGDVPFAIAALLMAFDFLMKLGPMFPQLPQRLAARYGTRPAEQAGPPPRPRSRFRKGR